MERIVRRSLPIAVRASITLSVIIGALFIASGIAAYYDISRQTARESLERLNSYSALIAATQEARFRRLTNAHKHAVQLLHAEFATRDTTADHREFDRLYPKDEQGTRHSADGLYDGAGTSLGYIRGIGAYIGRPANPRQASLILSATRVAHAIGEGIRPDLKSLYFFTPDNALVMFAPDRPDRLMFYRKTAPADLDFQQEAFARISTVAANPTRTTKCTPLVPILYDRSGRTWTTGCMTPFDVDGRHLGTWGTSVMLQDLLSAGELAGPPRTDVILISSEGMLIRHPDMTRQGKLVPERLLDLKMTRQPELAALWALTRQHGGWFSGHVLDLHALVSMRRIQTTGWYVIVKQDDAVQRVAANRALLRVGITAALCLLLQAIIVSVLLRRHVGRPLRQLTQRVRSFAATAADQVAEISAPIRFRDEVDQLSLDFRRMAARLVDAHENLERQVADRTEQLRLVNAELVKAAETDMLTGIPNRRWMLREVELWLAHKEFRHLYMLIIDIDHFKQVNDTFGHQAGDALLAEVAQDVRASLRKHDIFGRLGGEEFIAMIEAADLGEAIASANRVRAAVAEKERSFASGADVRVTISIGLAAAFDGATFSSLYASADHALYEAKRLGRNRCEVSVAPFKN
ncbi:diguanylate cyclase (GGDEF)-like protein [Sphingomonas zeicaulis]|uniref:GGDEF domain-containing protein n=1 Tax=Sphingomonas zeicaulis TaxID=1632740 RepID=UPI003D19F888